MNLQNLLGTVREGKIIDLNKDDVFVSVDGASFRVDKKEIKGTKPLSIKGYLYENQEHKLCMTTNIPKVRIGRFAFGTVVDVRTDLGVFVDIGLPDKDIVVSLDDLPEMKSLWPKKGDRLMISIKNDKKNRMWGELADMPLFQQLIRRPGKYMNNKNITGTVIRLKLKGTFVLTNDYYICFLHPSERDREPRLGEVVHGRVIGVNIDYLNISLKPRGYEEIDDDAAMVLAVLQHQPNGEMSYNDKSDPDDIKQYFGISKSSFKRALGHLMKSRLIEQTPESTKLTDAGKQHK